MIILLDTETTELDNPRLVEIGLGIIQDMAHHDKIQIYHERYSPEVKIGLGAMSIHGITNEDVEKCPPFKNGLVYHGLSGLNVPENIIVAHNAKFDISVLKAEGIDLGTQVIDTCKCSKKLLQDYPGVEFKLQYLRYLLKLDQEDIPEQIRKHAGHAHGAAADVLILYLLFRRMAAQHSLEELVDITAKPLLLNVMPFGKHKGSPIRELAEKDKGYATWVYNNVEDEDIVYTFKYWAKGRTKENK